MKERPILFNAEMVNAILSGRKSQTRRVMKQQPGSVTEQGRPLFFQHGSTGRRITPKCPYGQPGDRLWVRETWSTCPIYDAQKPSEMGPEYLGTIRYRADGQRSGKLRPSIFMPRWASRITLEITSVRVEQLCDISNDDAISEGIWKYPDEGCYKVYTPTTSFGTINPVKSYRSLWESINGPESWTENPWVWVVEFEEVKQ